MKKYILALMVSALVFTVSAQAAESEDFSSIKELVNTIMPGKETDSITPTPVSGLYEVVIGQEIFYTTRDARYIFQGTLLDWEQQVDLTNETRVAMREKMNPVRKKAIDALDVNDMIVFAPEETKHTITVFTDIDCGYCRKLHAELEQYYEQGIAIRYLAYPRAGLNSPSYHKAVAAWCAKDPQAALTAAKRNPNQRFEKEIEDCKDPVADQLQMAYSFGLSGTPTLVLEDGSLIPGYVPADRLAGILNSK